MQRFGTASRQWCYITRDTTYLALFASSDNVSLRGCSFVSNWQHVKKNGLTTEDFEHPRILIYYIYGSHRSWRRIFRGVCAVQVPKTWAFDSVYRCWL